MQLLGAPGLSVVGLQFRLLTVTGELTLIEPPVAVRGRAEADAEAPRASVIAICAIPVALDIDTERFATIPSGMADPAVPQTAQMKLPVADPQLRLSPELVKAGLGVTDILATAADG